MNRAVSIDRTNSFWLSGNTSSADIENSQSSMEREPLGKNPYKIAISRNEMQLAHQHRELTGEPIQTWVRRLIRENWDSRDPLPEDLGQASSEPSGAGDRLSRVEETTESGDDELIDVPKPRHWCVVFRRDIRAPRQNDARE